MGAGKTKRAESIVKLSSLVGFITLTIIGILFFIFAKQISGIFIPGETETIAMSALFIRIMALTFGFIGLQQVLNGAFRGSGNTMITMVLSIVTLWVLRFPLAFILSHYTNLGSVGIWIAYPLSNIAAGVIAIIWFARGTWKKKKITEEVKLSERTTEETIIEEGMN